MNKEENWLMDIEEEKGLVLKLVNDNDKGRGE